MTVEREIASAVVPAVSVIVVAYNAGEYLQPCIDALSRQSFAHFEAVIVDNASSDAAVKALKLPDARFRIDPVGENIGFAAANNRATRASAARWIATLNPDAVPDVRWLEHLLDATGRWAQAGAFGSTQLSMDDPTRLDGAGDVWHAAGVAWRALEQQPAATAPEEGETFAVCAAGALYDRALFLELGGFDEQFFCYCEDVDLAFRMRARGWGAIQVRDAVIHHAGSGTTGRSSDFTLYYGHRNRIWTFVKNTPGWLFWLLIPAHIALNLRMIAKAPDDHHRAVLKRACRDVLRDWRGLMARRRAAERERSIPVLSYIRMFAWRPRLITERGFLKDRSGRRRLLQARRLVRVQESR